MLLSESQRQTIVAGCTQAREALLELLGADYDVAGDIAAIDAALAAVNALASVEVVPRGTYKFSGCVDSVKNCDVFTTWKVGKTRLKITDVVGDYVDVEWPKGWQLIRTTQEADRE